MLDKIKNLDPQTTLLVKAVAGIIVINAAAIAYGVYVAKKDQKSLDS